MQSKNYMVVGRDRYNVIVLSVGKIKGKIWMEASHGKQKVGLDVFVLAPKSYSVAFRFVKITYTEGHSLETVKDASQNQELLNVLNGRSLPKRTSHSNSWTLMYSRLR